ncbi:MAG: LLM class F420-dependent oxidoreductase [Sporichthyaceae bacterium]
MRLGLNLGYWGQGNDKSSLVLAEEAERLGFSVVWIAEAYGSDAVSVLGYLAAKTSTIDIGAAVLQIPARAATITAMTTATLDTLTDGRFRLGLGVSGPQVSEGWYGVKFDDPLGRTREYVEVVRAALSRERVDYQGRHHVLPLPDGLGKPLHLTIHPPREHVPIYFGAVGPKNLALTGEIGDGWLALFPALEKMQALIGSIAKSRAEHGRDMTSFDVAPSLPLVPGEDVAACADFTRPFTALYIGGMGAKGKNFYHGLATEMGYGRQADEVQEAYLDKRYDDAAAALPLELLDSIALLGSRERIAERLQAYAGVGVTTINVMVRHPNIELCRGALRTLAEAAELSGVCE